MVISRRYGGARLDDSGIGRKWQHSRRFQIKKRRKQIKRVRTADIAFNGRLQTRWLCCLDASVWIFILQEAFFCLPVGRWFVVYGCSGVR